MIRYLLKLWNGIIGGVIFRIIIGAIITFSGYNPTGNSLYAAVVESGSEISSGLLLICVIWLAIHSIMLAATWSSLGKMGSLIIFSVLAATAYFLIDHDLVKNSAGFVWLGLVLYALFLGAGASAGIVWRRAFGVFITNEAAPSPVSDASDGSN